MDKSKIEEELEILKHNIEYYRNLLENYENEGLGKFLLGVFNKTFPENE